MATAAAVTDSVTGFSHTSELGTWTFQECRPAALASVVESIWEVRGTVAHSLSRIFPNGRVDLLVNLGPPQRVLDGPGLSAFDATCVSGVQSGPLLVEAGQGTHLFGVRLRAESAGTLFGAPMDSLANRLAELPDVIGRPAVPLLDRLRVARSFVARASVACRWIEASRARGRGPSAHVAWIASEIEAARGSASITHLRRTVRVSAKKLASDFRAQVGVTPKLLARLMRFQHAIGLLQAGRGLTDVALSAGYYDQAHLGLDFRDLAGVTPREFVATAYPDGTSAVA